MPIDNCKNIAIEMKKRYDSLFESSNKIKDVKLFCPHCSTEIDMSNLVYNTDDEDWCHAGCLVSPDEGILLESIFK